ncbi:MAG: Gfo/Idh/MocA family oxidoreductase, partial [Clostridia bacterium]|nr:Gfo/Idh/MocA family oxidoreductase [Clostridia bacterium]
NQGIHGIDILQYLVGPVKSVYGVCKTLARDIEVEDTASLVVEYANGAIGVIQGTTSVEPGYPRVLEITGTKGTISLREKEIIKWDVEGKSLDETQITAQNYGGFRNPNEMALDTHVPQIRDMIMAIEEDRPPMVDEIEGRKPVDIILAAYESSKLRKPVDLN